MTIHYLLITKKEDEKPYKVSFIFYGNVLQGERFTQRIGPRHPDYNEVDKIYKWLKQMSYGKKFRRGK